MRISIRTLLVVCLLAAIAFMVALSRQQASLKQDARRFYGELKLEPPIKPASFSYHLDGGSIETTLIDSNDVSLTLTASPPGGLFTGDTTAVYVGTAAQMWTTQQIQMGGQPIDAVTTGLDEPPIRLQRSSGDALRIANYLEEAVSASLRYTAEFEPQNDWQRWHFEASDREAKLLGQRMVAILRDDPSLSETHGNKTGMPPMPDYEEAPLVRR